jgi:hypothetical protein
MRWTQRVWKKPSFRRPKGASAPWDGRPVDLDLYWAEAWVDLRRRQDALARAHGLVEAQWVVDQEAGLIQFERTDGAYVTAPVQIIGSWNPKTEYFTWGWDHPSVRPRLRADAERTRWFGDRHGLPEFTQRSVKLSQRDAWRLTAVARNVNDAAGAYRGPTEGPVVFMTMGELNVRV